MATKPKDKPTLTPKLRFPEFWNAPGWVETPLKGIADPVAARATQGEGDNVLSLSAEHGIVLQSEFFGKRVAGDNSERYLKISLDDFVYNDRTTKASTYGTIKRLSKYSGGIVSPIYKCFRFNAAENPVFWEWYFESGTHDKQLRSLVNEGARAGRFNISITQFLSTAAWRPDEPEQHKIADCLSSIDELIGAEARKLDALKTNKIGLMQQLFPREGENQPRLRFPEFRGTGAWKERKAGGIFTNRTEDGETGLPIYSVTMNDGMVRRSSLDRDFDDIADPAGNKKAYARDIVYNMMRMWQGALGVAPEDCMVSPAYVVLSPQKGVCSTFFGYLLKLPKFLRLLTGNSQGLTKDRLRLYYQDFTTILLPFPSDKEQEKIADCLSSLDKLIAVKARKLDALKTHKKGLMQQLFASPEEVKA